MVPKISQPLYHPISKAKLKPGYLVLGLEYDMIWLI